MPEIKYELKASPGALSQIADKAKTAGYQLAGVLEEVHRVNFLESQAITHVISGSLKASGKTSTSWSQRDLRWEGTMEYGGALVRVPVPLPTGTSKQYSPSAFEPKDPVKYAVYERARGGPHDFFGPAPIWKEKYEAAIRAWLKS